MSKESKKPKLFGPVPEYRAHFELWDAAAPPPPAKPAKQPALVSTETAAIPQPGDATHPIASVPRDATSPVVSSKTDAAPQAVPATHLPTVSRRAEPPPPVPPASAEMSQPVVPLQDSDARHAATPQPVISQPLDEPARQPAAPLQADTIPTRVRPPLCRPPLFRPRSLRSSRFSRPVRRSTRGKPMFPRRLSLHSRRSSSQVQRRRSRR
jgi:hypothetical protein